MFKVAIIAALLCAAVAFPISAPLAASAGGYEGVWSVKNTAGQPFQITLDKDGTATGTEKEGLKGTWKEANGAVEIHWSSGWTTRIAKEGDHYKKSAFKPGASLTGTPTNTSDAEKAK